MVTCACGARDARGNGNRRVLDTYVTYRHPTLNLNNPNPCVNTFENGFPFRFHARLCWRGASTRRHLPGGAAPRLIRWPSSDTAAAGQPQSALVQRAPMQLLRSHPGRALALAAMAVLATFAGVGDAAAPTWAVTGAAGAPKHHAHLGCYLNSGGVSNPIFPDGRSTVPGLTRDLCLAQCAAYPYFGMAGASGDFCTCGTSVAGLPTAAGQCTTACAGESGRAWVHTARPVVHPSSPDPHLTPRFLSQTMSYYDMAQECNVSQARCPRSHRAPTRTLTPGLLRQPASFDGQSQYVVRLYRTARRAAARPP
jgi:hypothetical protein